MLLVLCSLIRSGIPGVKEWTSANALAFFALLLYAAREVAPPFLTIEVANGLLAGAISMVFVGFRRFFSLKTYGKVLAAGLAVVVFGIAIFHYGFDSIAIRTVDVSIFHGAVCLGIGATILRSEKSLRSRYPYFFTAALAILFGIGHIIRGIVYATSADVLTSSFQASPWNLLFLSIGTLVLPVFTMGAVMMTHDKMMAKAVEDANRDFLTGAWSRRALFEAAEHQLLRVSRTGKAFSLILLDVDNFKVINDTFGHAIGDRVLTDVVSQAGTVTRNVDYFARIGGEEFALLLPETGLPAAEQVAGRLRKALDRHLPVALSKSEMHTISYTVSLGVAELRHSESFSELLQRTDKALYQAKASGRNRVVASLE
jgi:diguanylate cyclase (GGDEF)-like protein